MIRNDTKAEGQRLVARFNKYVEYRRQVERSGEAFTEQLQRKAQVKEKQAKATPQRSTARSARRTQPPVLGKARNITKVQAQRLARYAPFIQDSAKRNNVPVELICGVILQESGGKANAVSHAGARGLMQLMPATARRFGVSNSMDAQQNIEGGTRYLRWLLDHFDGKVELALAGYNAGEHNVEKYDNTIPPFRETRAYVPAVLGYTQTMIDIFTNRYASQSVPSNARRV